MAWEPGSDYAVEQLVKDADSQMGRHHEQASACQEVRSARPPDYMGRSPTPASVGGAILQG